MRKIILVSFLLSLTFNSYAYTVLSKLECSSPNSGVSLATYEIRKANEAGQGRALVVDITFENDESFSLFQDFTPHTSFDHVKSFIVGEDGANSKEVSLVTLDTKDNKKFTSQISMNNIVYSLLCKKIK